jgi:hypothetical protein
MKAAIPLFLITLVSCAAVAVGCGDDDDDGTSGNPTTSSSGTAGGGGVEVPVIPMLGAQIERMGRPAINTALNHTFDPEQDTKDAAKDAWNTTEPSDWAGFVTQVADNLGVLDGLDAVCGNQLLAGAGPTGDRYDTLATVLADDRLWVNLNSATCTLYLGVEANATDAFPNEDCGGRRLVDDVIQTSYSLLAAGDLTFSIDDTIEANPEKTGGEVFPYLAPPQ